jgi:antitoxin ParD1/3/4
MAASVREVVESGEYASASEVMREALRECQLRRTERARAIGELRKLWDEGLASGDPVDGEQAFARIKSSLETALAKS